MSREKLKELLRKRSMKVGSVVLAAALVFGGGMWVKQGSQTPDLPVFVDPIETAVIEGEETPLASPQVTTKTTTKTKKKKIKLKKKSKKTYTKKGKTTTKKTSSTKVSGNTTTKTDTVTVTSIQDKFKKNSKTKTRITTTKTTVTTTKTTKNAVAAASRSTTTSSTAARTQASAFITARNNAYNENLLNSVGDVKAVMGDLGVDRRMTVAPSLNADGKFEASTGTVTVKTMNGTVYHELGHFVSFIAGNGLLYDQTEDFSAAYAEGKSKYKEYNKDYVLSSSSEYFAESFCQYVLDRNGLKSSRPTTYAAIERAVTALSSRSTRNYQFAMATWK